MSTRARILLVDDSPTSLFALVAALEEVGNPLVRAQSGEEALRELEHGEFALVLLDAHLPGLSGFETAREIKRREKTRHVPIIFLTGDERHLRRGYDEGAVDYLLKPVDAELLRAKVRVFTALHEKDQQLQRQAKLLKAQARAHERQRAFLDAIFEHIPGVVFVKDAETLTYYRLNREAETFFGISREEMLGRSDHEFFPGEAEFYRGKDREALSGGRAIEIDAEVVHTRRGPRWVYTKKVPILDDDGKPAYLLGLSQDITEKKRASEAILEAKEKAEAANRELETFCYSVSHDLRAPLRSIDGFSQALVEDCSGQLDAQGHDHLKRIRSAAQRMAQLIDALLELSRVARTELRRDRVDLSAKARSIVDELVRASSGRRVQVTIAPGMFAEGDPRLLRALLVNLIGNAWKFTSRRQEAHIEVGVEQGSPPVFFVRDDGAGFDPAYAHKLFGAFQRLHAASEFEGTGVGLATVQRIVHRHGGRVWAESAPGAGATFRFTLSADAKEAA